MENQKVGYLIILNENSFERVSCIQEFFNTLVYYQKDTQIAY